MNYGLYKKMEIFVGDWRFYLFEDVLTGHPTASARKTRHQEGDDPIPFGRIHRLLEPHYTDEHEQLHKRTAQV